MRLCVFACAPHPFSQNPFYHDPALGRVQVSLVSGGDAVCRATNTGPAFSTREALDFVACGKVAGGPEAVPACVNSLFGQ